MNIEVAKVSGPETIASLKGEDYLKCITDLMTYSGIESINAQKFTCGFGTRLHVSIAPFANVPETLYRQGIIVKDALGTLLSVANISRVVIKPSDEELEMMHKMWDDFAEEAMLANSGSSQNVDSQLSSSIIGDSFVEE